MERGRTGEAAPSPEVSGTNPRWSAWYLFGGVAWALAYLLLPQESSGQRGLVTCGSLAAAIAIVLGIRHHRPRHSAPWWLLGASMGIYFPAAVIFNFAYSFPSPADAIFFVSYGLQLAALLLIVRRRTAGATLGFWLDAGLITVAAAVVSYVFFLHPYVFMGATSFVEAAATVGYPLFDGLLLITMLMLALSLGSRPVAFWLLLGSVAAQLTADIFYAYSVLGGWFDYGDPFFAGWLVAWALLGAAALHPSMRTLTERVSASQRSHQTNPLRIPLLGLAAIAPSVTNAAGYLLEAELPVHLISSASVLLIVLMTLRIAATTRSLEQANAELIERDIRLQTAIEVAERANAEKTGFLSRVSHELRTPLNSILGFAQVMDYEELSAENRESVDHILASGKHLLTLINEILDTSRVERGEISLSMESLPLAAFLDEVTRLMQPLASARGVSLVAHTDDLTNEAVLADAVRLRQILLNLISNAIKYNRPDGSVTVTASGQGDKIRIEVQDTGSGLTADQLRRLFTPFERVGAETTTVEGTGLGLAVSKRFAEAMDGKIEVTSEVGRGSIFSIELNRGEPVGGFPESAEATHSGASSPHSTAQPASATVLYIDDNVANLKLMQRVLASRPDINLRTASDATTGLRIAREDRPHLILLDLNLPDMWGGDALRHLRSDATTREIPVVMVTADAHTQRVEELLELGASDYVSKPFDMKALLVTVDAQLTRGDV